MSPFQLITVCVFLTAGLHVLCRDGDRNSRVRGELTNSSEVSRSRLLCCVGVDLTAGCEVEAILRTMLSVVSLRVCVWWWGGGGGVGGCLSQPGWVNGHGPCGIWPFGRGSPSTAALRAS